MVCFQLEFVYHPEVYTLDYQNRENDLIYYNNPTCFCLMSWCLSFLATISSCDKYWRVSLGVPDTRSGGIMLLPLKHIILVFINHRAIDGWSNSCFDGYIDIDKYLHDEETLFMHALLQIMTLNAASKSELLM